MKSIYFPVLLLLSFSSVYSQQTQNITDNYPRFTLSTSIGIQRMTFLKSGLDEQLSLGTSIDFNYNVHLKSQHYLSVGVGYELSRHITDAFFSKTNNQFAFGTTPDGFKQHEVNFQYLQVPVLYKYRWVNSGMIGIGAYGGYLLHAESLFKTSAGKNEVEAPIQNKFRWGLQGEWEFVNKDFAKRRGGSVFGMGVRYQLSDHLNDIRTFKPLFAYVRLGVSLR